MVLSARCGISLFKFGKVVSGRNWSGTRLHNVIRSCSFSDESKMPFVSEKLEVNGAEIHYDKLGHGEHCVLLLPGALGSSRTDFQNQILHLNRDVFTVIAWDPRGYGLSIPPERTWDKFFERDASDALALMQKLNIEKYSLAGWSDGGITALIMAARSPQTVTKLVVWGANAFVTDEDVKMYENIKDLEKWSDRMREPYENVYGREYFSKHWRLWVDSFSSYKTKGDGDICKKDLLNIVCPTLIIHGQKDPLVPQHHADYLHQNIKNSRLLNMPEGKHNLHMKFYKEFNSKLEEFIVH